VSPKAIVFYRGPLGRSRVGFLLDAITRAYGDTTFMWACTRPMAAQLVRHFQTFIERVPGVSDWEILDGHLASQISGISRIRSRTRGDLPIIAVGFTTLHLLGAAGRRATLYCPSGIPEERLLGRRSVWHALGSASNWALLRALPEPTMTVTVSTRMSELFHRRTGWSTFEVVPLCVDRTIFQPGPNSSRFGYLGTGAAWQGLDQLADTWRLLSQSMPSAEFRVISRDERTRILVDAVGDDRCDTVAADQPEDVARALHGCRVGFLLRSNHLVNRVAYPTKVGEYLASGVPVVATDIDWDVGDLIRDMGCGTLVPSDAGPATIATATKDLLARDRDELLQCCDRGATALERAAWVSRLASRLPGSNVASR
jgi:glycosyltransferase involved in cell wall biosynthesis